MKQYPNIDALTDFETFSNTMEAFQSEALEILLEYGKAGVECFSISGEFVKWKVKQLAPWVMANFPQWLEVVEMLGKKEAILSLFFAYGDKSEKKQPLTLNDIIAVHNEIRVDLPKLQELANLALIPKTTQKAGGLIVSRENQISKRFFGCDVGKYRMEDENGNAIEVDKRKVTMPLDMATLPSLFVSLAKNKPIVGADGKEYYAISKGAFARAFLKLTKGKITQGNLDIIERSVERLLGLYYTRFNVDIPRRLGGSVHYSTDERERAIFIPKRFLPLEGDGLGVKIKQGGALVDAWAIEKEALENSPYWVINKQTCHLYEIGIDLMPANVPHDEPTLNAVFEILYDYVNFWYRNMENPPKIHLETLVAKYGAKERTDAGRKARERFLDNLIAICKAFNESGLCEFAVGYPLENGKLDFFHDAKEKKQDGKHKKEPNYLLKHRNAIHGKPKVLMVTKVDRKSAVWQRVLTPTEGEIVDAEESEN